MLKGTTEGCLATILIYHQLVEEMLRLLIRDAQFLIQLGVFPSRMAFREKRKQMFGQLQQELKDLVDFEGKNRFLTKIEQINSIRVRDRSQANSARLTWRINPRSTSSQQLYDDAFVIFDQAHDNFRVAFHGYKKDVFELH